MTERDEGGGKKYMRVMNGEVHALESKGRFI